MLVRKIEEEQMRWITSSSHFPQWLHGIVRSLQGSSDRIQEIVFYTKLVNDAERKWLLKNFPNQRDHKGEEKDGLFSMSMDIAYKTAGKEMLCMMLKFVDDGCVTTVYGK